MPPVAGDALGRAVLRLESPRHPLRHPSRPVPSARRLSATRTGAGRAGVGPGRSEGRVGARRRSRAPGSPSRTSPGRSRRVRRRGGIPARGPSCPRASTGASGRRQTWTPTKSRRLGAQGGAPQADGDGVKSLDNPSLRRRRGCTLAAVASVARAYADCGEGAPGLGSVGPLVKAARRRRRQRSSDGRSIDAGGGQADGPGRSDGREPRRALEAAAAATSEEANALRLRRRRPRRGARLGGAAPVAVRSLDAYVRYTHRAIEKVAIH